MESFFSFLSPYWDNKVYPFISSQYGSLLALADRTEPLYISLQNALLLTKDAAIAWMRVLAPLIVFVLQQVLWIISHVLRLIEFVVRWSWPHVKRGVEGTKAYIVGLDRRVKVIIVVSIVLAILIAVLFRKIAKSKWLARMITGYRSMRERAGQRYHAFIESVAEQSRFAACILPHILYIAAAMFLHFTLFSQAHWLASSFLLYTNALIAPAASILHALISFYYLPSADWQRAIVLANVPVTTSAPAARTAYTAFHLRIARALYGSPHWLNTVRAALVAEAEYVSVLALLYALWLQPVLGHLMHVTTRWPLLPLACLFWLRSPLTGGAALIARFLRQATAWYAAADAKFGNALSTVAEAVQGDQDQAKDKDVVEGTKDTTARRSWVEAALSLPLLPASVRSGLLSLHREGGLLLLPCLFFLFTPGFLTFYATIVAGLVRPAYALLYTLPAAHAALTLARSRAVIDAEGADTPAVSTSPRKPVRSPTAPTEVPPTPSRFSRLVSFFTPRSASAAVARIARPPAVEEADLFSLDTYRTSFEPLAAALSTALVCLCAHVLFCMLQGLWLVSLVPLLPHVFLLALLWLQLPWSRGAHMLLGLVAPYVRAAFEAAHALHVDTEADPAAFAGSGEKPTQQLQSVQKQTGFALLPAVQPLMVLASPLLSSVARRRHARRLLHSDGNVQADADECGEIEAEENDVQRLPDVPRVVLQPYRDVSSFSSSRADQYSDTELHTPVQSRVRRRFIAQYGHSEDVLEDVVEESEQDLMECVGDQDKHSDVDEVLLAEGDICDSTEAVAGDLHED